MDASLADYIKVILHDTTHPQGMNVNVSAHRAEKSSLSNSSSIEIIVNDPEDMDLDAPQASSVACQTTEVAESTIEWNNSCQDLSSYKSRVPTINDLRKRRPHMPATKPSATDSEGDYEARYIVLDPENFPNLDYSSLPKRTSQAQFGKTSRQVRRFLKAKLHTRLEDEEANSLAIERADVVKSIIKNTTHNNDTAKKALVENTTLEHTTVKNTTTYEAIVGNATVGKAANEIETGSKATVDKTSSYAIACGSSSVKEHRATEPHDILPPHLQPKGRKANSRNLAIDTELANMSLSQATGIANSSGRASSFENCPDWTGSSQMQPSTSKSDYAPVRPHTTPVTVKSDFTPIKPHTTPVTDQFLSEQAQLAPHLRSKGINQLLSLKTIETDVASSCQSETSRSNIARASPISKGTMLGGHDIVRAFEKATRKAAAMAHADIMRRSAIMSAIATRFQAFDVSNTNAMKQTKEETFTLMTTDDDFMAVALTANEAFAKKFSASNALSHAKANVQTTQDPGRGNHSLRYENNFDKGNGLSKRKVDDKSTQRSDSEKLAVATYSETKAQGPDHPGVRLMSKGKRKVARLSDCSTNDSCRWMNNTSGKNPEKAINDDEWIMLANGSAKLSAKSDHENSIEGSDRQFKVAQADDKNSLGGYNGQFKPAPLGDEWSARDSYDADHPKHIASIKEWARASCHALNKPIDTQAAEFTTGQGVIVSGVLMRKTTDNSIHDTRPHRTTENEPRRVRSGEQALKEHLAYFGFHPESFYKSPKKRDDIFGMSNREKRELVKFYIDAYENNNEPNENAPVANIYMRPALESDMGSLARIHNFYIDSSTATHIKKSREIEQWLKIFRDCQANHCPFIVAIVSKNPKRINRAEDVQPDMSELVVGFAFQKHYGDEDSKFDYTLKLEIWVHQAYTRQGIGATMLDRMLACTDPMYSWKDPAPFIHADAPIKWMAGGSRVVHNLILEIFYSSKDEPSANWRWDWFMKNGFVWNHDTPNITQKFGKSIDMMTLTYQTGHSPVYLTQ